MPGFLSGSVNVTKRDKRGEEYKKAFTLVEIIFVVIIIGILATLGYPMYENLLEDSHRKTCEMNLKVMGKALEVQVQEGASPTTLGELRDDYIEKAYAGLMQGEESLRLKIAWFLHEVHHSPFVYAQSVQLKVSRKLRCPKAAEGDNSYGLNATFAAGPVTYAQFKALAATASLIGDCSSTTFTSDDDLTQRHARYVYSPLPTKNTYAMAVTAGLTVKTIGDDPTPGSCPAKTGCCIDWCTANYNNANCSPTYTSQHDCKIALCKYVSGQPFYCPWQ